MPLARDIGFAGVLRDRAEYQPEATAFVLVDDAGEQRELSYGELDARARAVAAVIQASAPAGERALLLYPPGDEYVVAVFGCLLAGVLAVPAYPPDPTRFERTMPRLRAIARDARACVVLTTEAGRAAADNGIEMAPQVLATDTGTDGMADAWRPQPVGPSDAALLQYTSGSTASPRGVMLSHANLLENSEFIRLAFGHSASSRGVSWLPPYHDMGLIGGVLQPVYAGFPCVLMSPLSFLRRPLRWLQAVSDHRATSSGGPDFAFARCVRHTTEEQRVELDLSAWNVAFTGSELVRRETLDAFSEAFAGCGFRREAFYPCYGLAEATLMVAGTDRRRPPRIVSVDREALERDGAAVVASEGLRARDVVSCGRPGDRHRLLIADPVTGAPRESAHVGEIWVSGPSVASGYWECPEATEVTFGGGFLRTGDLGFLLDGELFVTGRLKELVIVGGRNHYPADIELACESAVSALRPGCGAAFSMHGDGRERVAIVYEVNASPSLDSDAVIRDVRLAVTRALGPPLDVVVLVHPRSVPKTSSGKVQRGLCRSMLLARELNVVAEWSLPG